jgi:FlaA1/EpsC-like NDP-sugar epimerase
LPVLVTDPDATRFFMAVTEAASLVMKASLIAEGGETFWLDMGPQIRIGDLVDRLLRAEAEQGFEAVPVQIIGLRPGEKLQEQLASQGISLKRTIDSRIWVARQPRAIAARLALAMQALRRGVARDEASTVLQALTMAVSEFVPSAFAKETAQQSDAEAGSSSRRSTRVRNALPNTQSRAA